MDKCGYIAIIGRPNVGKSTLLNAILGEKVSITSRKPQTTRYQILGIKTEGNTQAVYIDTPGLHQTESGAMHRYMNRLASAAMADADVIVFMIDSIYWKDADEFVLSQLMHAKAPVILLINKIDTLKDKQLLLPFMDKIKDKYNFYKVIPLSVKQPEDARILEKEIQDLLPENPHFFPDEQLTDKNIYFRAAELLREKIFQATGQEVPYSSTVQIERIKKGKRLISVDAVIWVEREGQKAILIGKSGATLKKIATRARQDMEVLFKKKVLLHVWVKIKAHWTENEKMLRELGYGEGEGKL